jgi:hypothetical protein
MDTAPQIEFRSNTEDGQPWWLPPKQFLPTTSELSGRPRPAPKRGGRNNERRNDYDEERLDDFGLDEDRYTLKPPPKPGKACFDPVSGVYLPSSASLKHHRKKFLQKRFERETERLIGAMMDGKDKREIAAKIAELQEGLSVAQGAASATTGGKSPFPDPERQHQAAIHHIKRIQQEEEFGPRDPQVMKLASSLSSAPYVAGVRSLIASSSGWPHELGYDEENPETQDAMMKKMAGRGGRGKSATAVTQSMPSSSAMKNASRRQRRGGGGGGSEEAVSDGNGAWKRQQRRGMGGGPVSHGDPGSSIDLSQLLPPAVGGEVLGAVALRVDRFHEAGSVEERNRTNSVGAVDTGITGPGGLTVGSGPGGYEYEVRDELDEWQVMELSYRYSLCLPAEGNSVEFSPSNGATLAIGHESGLTLWSDRQMRGDYGAGACNSSTISTIECGSVMGLRWSHDGQCIASGMFGDTQVHLWEVGSMSSMSERTHRYLRQELGHTDWVRAVAWSPDDNFLVSGGNDGKVKVWDLGGVGAPLRSFKHERGVWCVDWSTAGESGWHANGAGLIAAGDYTGIVALYDVRQNEPITSLEQGGVVTSVRFTADGSGLLVATDTQGGCLQMLDMRMLHASMAVDGGEDAEADDGASDSAAPTVVPTPGLASIAFGRAKNAAEQANPGGMDEQQDPYVPTTARFGRHNRCVGAGLSPDGRCAISGGMDGVVKMWDINESRCLAEMKGHKDKVRAVAWSADSSTMASVSDDCSVRVYGLHRA